MSYFNVQEPPQGGLTRLRARLDRRPQRHWVFVASAVLAALVAAVVGVHGRLTNREMLVIEPSSAAYALGLIALRGDEVVLSSSAPMAALNGPGAGVRVYAVMSDVIQAPTSR